MYQIKLHNSSPLKIRGEFQNPNIQSISDISTKRGVPSIMQGGNLIYEKRLYSINTKCACF